MEKKRPIDILRESSGFADIGTKEEGNIITMFELNDKLIIVKEKAIYEFVLADSIDPSRLNPDLPPNIQKLIINQGSDSEMVSRIFLASKMLLTPQFLSDTIEINKVLQLILELLPELSILDSEIKEYVSAEIKVINEYRDRISKKLSFSIPSITDVQTRCKTIFQKADHLEQILIEIIALFYPLEGFTKQSHIPKFYEFLEGTYSKNDRFTLFIKDSLDYFEVNRAVRNCLDHRLKNVQIRNFELHITSSVITPTIELDYRGIKLERQSLSQTLPYVYDNFITIFENTLAYMCNKNAKKNLMQYKVSFIPPEKRINKYINYCFWSPIGQDGYYYQ